MRRPSPLFAGAAKWSKDGKAIYYITDRGSEFRRLARHDLVTGADAVLSGSIPWDIEESTRAMMAPSSRRSPTKTAATCST